MYRPQGRTQGAEQDVRHDGHEAMGSRLSFNVYEQFKVQQQQVQELAGRVAQSSYALVAIFAVGLCGIAMVVVHWSQVKENVAEESAKVISSTISNEELQHNASEFSKALLHQLLTDKSVQDITSKWVMKVLEDIQDNIGQLFVKILALEPVVEAVNRLADRLVAHLCSSEYIQQQVGRLLVDAICLDYSRDASAQWAIDLVNREDVIAGFSGLVTTALQTDGVVAEATNLGQYIVNSVLADPEIAAEARRLINDTLRDGDVRAAAKEGLWAVMNPFAGGGKKQRPEGVQKALSDLMDSGEITPEERAILRSVQQRMASQADLAKAKEQQAEATATAKAEAAAMATAKAEAEAKAKEQLAAAADAKAEAEAAAKAAQERADAAAKAEAEAKALAEAEAKARAQAEAKAEAEVQARQEVERRAAERAQAEADRSARAAEAAEAAAEAQRLAREAEERAAAELEARRVAAEKAANEAAATRAAEKKPSSDKQAKNASTEEQDDPQQEASKAEDGSAGGKDNSPRPIPKEESELELVRRRPTVGMLMRVRSGEYKGSVGVLKVDDGSFTPFQVEGMTHVWFGEEELELMEPVPQDI